MSGQPYHLAMGHVSKEKYFLQFQVSWMTFGSAQSEKENRIL